MTHNVSSVGLVNILRSMKVADVEKSQLAALDVNQPWKFDIRVEHSTKCSYEKRLFNQEQDENPKQI